MSMKIIQGELPTDKAWRVLVMLAPGESLGRMWYLGLSLAQANRGELLTAVIVPDTLPATMALAQVTFDAAEAASIENENARTFIIEDGYDEHDLQKFISDADIDLIIARADGPTWRDFNKLSCALIVSRGDRIEWDPQKPIQRILIPTAGGPNTAYALSYLLPLTPKVEITTLYVVPAHLGANEEALARARLRQMIHFVDGGDRIQSKVITSPSVIEGIVEEAAAYDLMIIGASMESPIDKILFGDVTAAVVRESKTPVMVARRPKDRIGNWAGQLAWWFQRLIPRLSLAERTDAYVRIRRGARPDTDFYVLISLAAIIAALGLVVDSAAVVIGAMLVAPLMSPIVGIGLAIVLGDTRFLRLSLGAVLRGVVLAVGVSAVSGLLLLNEPLTSEIFARTQPTLIDLGIALFSGVAVAYALCHSQAAGALPGVAIAAALVPPLSTVGITLVTGHYRESLGALLLFTTNLVAISLATALTFLMLGFRPAPTQKVRRQAQVRSVRVAFVLLLLVAGLLALTTYNLARESRMEARIFAVTEQKLREVVDAELAAVDVMSFENGRLQLEVTARSTHDIPFNRVRALQEAIGIQLKEEGILEEVALTLTVIRVTELDPLVPPTPTPVPSPTPTVTPGPSPTASAVPTLTPTVTATAVPTVTPLPTASPTSQPTMTPLPTETAVPPTPTPETAVVVYPYGLNFRAVPGMDGEILGRLEEGTVVVLLAGRETADNHIWQEIMVNGQIGWVASEFLEIRP